MVLAQMEGFRPIPELAQFRTPGVKGLYIAGFCIHSGGGMMGGPRVIAVDIIAQDLKIDKWWEDEDY